MYPCMKNTYRLNNKMEFETYDQFVQNVFKIISEALDGKFWVYGSSVLRFILQKTIVPPQDSDIDILFYDGSFDVISEKLSEKYNIIESQPSEKEKDGILLLTKETFNIQYQETVNDELVEKWLDIDIVQFMDYSYPKTADCDVNSLFATLNVDTMKLTDVKSCHPDLYFDDILWQAMYTKEFTECDGNGDFPKSQKHVCQFDEGYKERSKKMLAKGWKHAKTRPLCLRENCLFFHDGKMNAQLTI
jgi:hypothetical protein